MSILFKSINQTVVLFCGFLFLSTGLTTFDMMLDPICQAKCLKDFRNLVQNSDNSQNILKNPYLIKSFCLNELHCKMCMMPCGNSSQPLETCLSNCKALQIEYQETCGDSCHFINEKKINRPGICPEVKRKSQCSYSCNSDLDCFKQGTKCCKNKLCNSTCQITEFPKHGVPEKPAAPLVRQIINESNPDQLHFDLDWTKYNISSVDYPVLFVVQIRIGHLNQARNTVSDRWHNLVSTSKSGVIISAIYLETWYQFRLLAFSENGISGVGDMTIPVTVNYSPRNPVAPKNVTEKVTRINNGKISVTLVWQPADSKSLLPISNYKISWKRIYELNENNPLVTEYEISIPATETQYTIENLLPSASYVVNIVSVVVYKDEKYNSSAAIYYISTASIQQQKKYLELIKEYDSEAACVCGYSNIHLPVIIDSSTIIKNQLAMRIRLKNGINFDQSFAPYSFRIRWQPMACVESHSTSNESVDSHSFVTKDKIDHYLTGLRFHCNYRIEIELFSQIAMKIIKIWEGCFCTPNCNTQISKTGKAQSPCLSKEHIPPTVNHLQVILKRSNSKSNTDAELFWTSEPGASVTAFRITWGPRLEEPIDETMYGRDFMPILDSRKALSKVVNYPIHQSLLKDLNIGKVYIVKLEAIDHYSTSRENSIFFKVHSETNSSQQGRFSKYFLFLSLFIYKFLI